MDKLQADKLTEVKEVMSKITPGPWNIEGMEIWRRGESYGSDTDAHVFIGDVVNARNRHLIAHAPEYITYLLQLVETQAQALEEAQNYRFEYEKLAADNHAKVMKLWGVLSWYAKEENYKEGELLQDPECGDYFNDPPRVIYDQGRRAREIIKLTQV